MNNSESKYFHTAVRFDKALLSLLEKKPFVYVTVSEVCERAGLNRSTFYLHYENTSDLLKESIGHLIDSFCSCFSVETERISEKFTNCELKDLV